MAIFFEYFCFSATICDCNIADNTCSIKVIHHACPERSPMTSDLRTNSNIKLLK